MSTAFDPLRAAREELAGLSDVARALSQRQQKAEEAMALAESELNAIRKISGYLRITMDTIRQRVAELERG